jgi:selenocysteine lyase/cysteine desulfurase
MLIHACIALAAPYVKMDMNPLLHGAGESVHKDAMFFSVHKFVGGVQTPGKFGTRSNIKTKLNPNFSLQL